MTETNQEMEYIRIGGLYLCVEYTCTVLKDFDCNAIDTEIDSIDSVTSDSEDVDLSDFTYKGRELEYWIRKELDSK